MLGAAAQLPQDEGLEAGQPGLPRLLASPQLGTLTARTASIIKRMRIRKSTNIVQIFFELFIGFAICIYYGKIIRFIPVFFLLKNN